MKKILSLIIASLLIVSTISFVSAMTEHETEIYNRMTNIFTKIKYAIQKGLFLFTSWGQANCCDVYPKSSNVFWLKKGERIDCDDYCSYDKCAIDIWYDNTICVIGMGDCPSDGCPLRSPSGDPNWNKWDDEYKGEGASFRGTNYCWYYAEVYCCPKECVTEDHSTRVYVCENGGWDRKSRYDKDESCPYDRGCWCADENENKYYDETGNEHCRSSPKSSWCTAYIAHYRKTCVGSGTTEYFYWYDSLGNRNDLIDTCSSNERCTTSGCVQKEPTTDCTDGQVKCVGSGTTSNEVVACDNGKWGTVGGLGWANCISGTICDVGNTGTNVCYTPSGVICDYDLKCESGQGETTTTCPTDCCTEPDTTCNYATKEYYICKGTEWENQGKVEGRCGYTEGGCHGTKQLGSMSYCSSTCKCGEGEGDCDYTGTDKQCNTGLICVANVGADYGFSSGTDVCEKTSGCTSHTSQKCYSNDVYWYDSCGERETKKEECGTLGCPSGSSSCGSGCTSHASRKCYNNDVYWYDSCGKRETKKEECGTLGCPSGSSSCGSAKQCGSNADSNNDGVISRSELGSYINKWIAGTKTRTTLGKAIMEWVGGC